MPAAEIVQNQQPPFKHRRTHREVRRCKKAERTDLRPSEWGRFGYAARADVITRPIVYDSQTLPIPRIRPCDITPQSFFRDFTSQCRPVIVEGAAADWPAMERWSIEKLEERFRHVAFKVGEDDKGKKLRMKFKYYADYLGVQEDDNPLYLFETGLEDSAAMQSLFDDYEVPDLFPDDWLNLVNRDARPPHRWFCIGPKRSGTTVHTDPLGTSAWNAVTHGCKRWVLFEPSSAASAVKGKAVRQKGEDDEAVMYFDFLLPRLKAANPALISYEGLQRAGDVIFVPGGWWHGVLNVEDCVAVTQNYCGPDNFEFVWCRTRKDREKLAHLWLRNMKKFAPDLHRQALEFNRRDKFRMRHEREPGERLPDASSSSSDSSDSSSDEFGDLSKRGTSRFRASRGASVGNAPCKRPYEEVAVGAPAARPCGEVLQKQARVEVQ